MKERTLETVFDRTRTVLTALGGYLGAFAGGTDGMLIALIAFMALDYVTGVMCAAADRSLSSQIGFRGICRKVLIWLLVGAANLVDVHVAGTGSALRSAVICFYLSNEGLSLLENAARLGLPIPERLKEALAQLRGKEEK